MRNRIKNKLINLKEKINQNISPRKQQIIAAATTVPIIATSNMSGVCAASCPYGIVYCPAPGQCHRYIDLNGSGACDLSLSEAGAASSAATTGSGDNSSSTSGSGDSSSTSDSNGVTNLDNGSSDHSNASVTTTQDPSSGTGSDSINVDTNYHIIPVSLLIIGAYFFTHYLFSKGILKPKKHKRLWNSLLMAGCIGSSITGVLLIYMINLSVGLAYRQGLTYWHVELSLLMVIVTLIHFHIYRKPFKNMFKVLFPFKSMVNKNKSSKNMGKSK